jgi:site-specific DNA recombinase
LQVTEAVTMDTSDPMHGVIRFLQAFQSNQERRNMLDRTLNGMNDRLANGFFCSMAPYGYRNATDENGVKVIIIDDEKAFVVRLIFAEFLKGSSVEEIRRLAQPFGFKNKGNSAIQRILANPVYAGLINVPAYKNKPQQIVKGRHLPIISEEDYWRAQAQLKRKNHAVTKRDEVYLKGVLNDEAGRKMTAGNSKGKSKTYWYYVSPSNRKHFPANKLHEQFQYLLEQLSLLDEEKIA